MASKESPLAGKRILIPPARPEVNPLLLMLKKKGAEAVEFPGLRPDVVSKGHIADLVRTLVDLFGK